MNLQETAHLLAVMQPYDQRTVGETDVIAWHAVLAAESFADCTAAAVAHYSASTDRAMPAHVLRLVKAAQRERINTRPAIDVGAIRQTSPPPEWFELRKRLAARPRRERASFAAAMQDMAGRLEQTAQVTE